MRLTNALALTTITILLAASLSAQNAPTAAKAAASTQPKVFVPPAARVPASAMQRRVAMTPPPQLQRIPAPVSSVVSLRPRPEPELMVPAAAPATTHGSGTMAADFRNGQLSVVADDAELGKVLQLIGEKTGASVEVAPEIAGERVIAHLGPGPAGDIVATLLNSPRLDFILMGSEDQTSIKRLIVRRKASFGRELSQSRAQPIPAAGKPEDSKAEPPSQPPVDQPAPESEQQTPPR